MGIIKLMWHGTLPNINIAELEFKVINDIRQSLKSLDRPSELIFHNVFIGNTMNDEMVSVWGEAGDDQHFHCEYIANPEWVSLTDLEKMEKDNE